MNLQHSITLCTASRTSSITHVPVRALSSSVVDSILLCWRLGHMFGTDRTWIFYWVGRGAHDDTTSLVERWTFYKSIHTQAGFLVWEHVSRMNDRMAHGDLELLAYTSRDSFHPHTGKSCLLAPYSVDAWPRFGPRTKRTEYTGDSDTLLGGRVVRVSLYQHRQIHIPT
jgi:hypothetical protein